MNKEDISSIVPLLPAQQFMLSASVREGQKTYVQQLLFEVRNFEGKAIEKAVDKVVQAYECLRSIILYEGLKQPVWVSFKNMKPEFGFQKLDLKELEQFCSSQLSRGFNLDRESAMRLDWIETAAASYLLITYHHILFDGWGRQKILSEVLFALRYPQAILQLKYNKNWYEAWKKLNHSTALDAYKKYLITFDNIAGLSYPSKGLSQHASLSLNIEESVVSNAAKSMGLTQAEYVLFAWTCFISKWCNRENVQIGQVKQNGLIESCREGFGLGIQTLPFQLRVDFNEQISALLSRFKERERAISAYTFVDTTNEIFQQLSYDFIMAFENYPIEKSLAAQGKDFILRSNYDFSEFPFSLAISPKHGQLIFDWHYSQKQHSKEQIESIAVHFIRLLKKLAYSSDLSLEALELLEQEVKPEFHININIEDFFQKIETHLELSGKSSLYLKLTDYFTKKKFSRIWIVGDKHAQSALLFVAAWRSGVEVLSLNEMESHAFIEKLLEEHPADLIFTSQLNHLFPEAIALDSLEQLPEKRSINVSGKSAAALSICTSGSTGTPKVVQLSIENLLAFFEAWDRKLPWKSTEIFAAIAHPAFDIGIAELIFPLWKGWETRLIGKDILSDTQKLAEALKDVSAFHMVPSLLEQWIDHSQAEDKCRIIMTGGDKVPPSLQKKLHRKFPQARLFQFYGPSECSVLACGFENKGQYEAHLLPLGAAFAHCGLSIFDSTNKVAAPFQEGEIIVYGPAVGLGYANSDNHEKFFEYLGQKAYKTGDLGFYDAEGNLFFKGRKDSQIKINGQRIELTRIEFALYQCSSIEHWVVIPNGNMLFAFGKSQQIEFPFERAKLLQWLPFYAIPQLIEILAEFPLNKNGKVDTQKLLDYGVLTLENKKQSISIVPEIENCIIELFKDKSINFSVGWYANGLNSIDALKLSGILKSKYKRAIDLNKILGVEKLFTLFQIDLDQVSQTEDLKIIKEGQKVHSTAARLLFLSESDELFFKSYWISSGTKLSADYDLVEIKRWLSNQSNLHFSVAFDKSDYIWKNAKLQLIETEIVEEVEFIKMVENTYLDIYTSLFICFIGRSKNENFLAFKVHHALLDGLGLELVWEKLYHDLKNNQVSNINLIAPKEEPIDLNFWEKYLKDVEVTALVFERHNSFSSEAARINIKLSAEEKQILTALCKSHNCSMFEAGLLLFVQMMSVFAPKNQAIGIPVNTGEFIDDENISAMSVNILPFKTSHKNLEEILINWRTLFKIRLTPFSEIAKLNKNQKNGLPFFNSTYLYHSQNSFSSDFKSINFKRAAADFNISLDFIEDKKDLVFSWEYKNDFFTETAIYKLHQLLFRGIETKKQKTYKVCEDLKIVWKNILADFPQKTGLLFQGISLSYLEIDDYITNYRMKYIPQDSIDVLILERNPESICNLLFHLIDGIAFIPVDHETSIDRINHIREISMEIKTSNKEFKLLQYVIATSGTTGVPKLVGVGKVGYAAAVNAWVEDYNLLSSDCFLQAASFSFDVSLGDIGRCFFNGASLVLLDAAERKDPSLMLSKINEFSVTLFETTPLVVRWWLADEIKIKDFPSLRMLIVGSDSWKLGELRSFASSKLANQQIINSYGLSETTIDNSFFDLDCDDHDDYSNEMVVPIGKAMKHCDLVVVNDKGVLLEDGMEGFIGIKGPAVGFGYFVNGSWTNKQNEFWQSKDRGICDEWGNFHFKGRADRQVKIRGQRVELEEVERILNALSPAQIWFVIDFEHEFSSEMAAFYIGHIDESDLHLTKTKLIDKYPSYFLPSIFVEIESVPLNTNGKTDVGALRKIANNSSTFSSFLQEDTDLTERLLAHFNQCFNQRVEPGNHFFQFGKNSFDAMHFVRNWNKINKEKIAVHQLFSAESFQVLAQVIGTYQKNQLPNLISQNISKAQEAIWYEIKNGNSSLYNLPHFIDIPEKYNVDKVRLAFEKALKCCPALFVCFNETEFGDVNTQPQDSKDFTIPVIETKDLNQFKEDAFSLEFDFQSSLPFKAALIRFKEKSFLYFNPHHLVYDGGSDAHLSKLFIDFFEDRLESTEVEDPILLGKQIDWPSYFNLVSGPEIFFNKADTSLQPSLILPCTTLETNKIKELCLAYQCTPTTIISYLLSKALHLANYHINWISIALDHRTQDCVGMHMRAYPFPAFELNSDVNSTIAKQKWALSQLFAANEQNIIYPISTINEAYHQVGLIIQHPFTLGNVTSMTEKIEYSRPRLPLSLYVEEINDIMLFRWEFDNKQLSIEKIRDINALFFNSADELILIEKKIINFDPQTNVVNNKLNSDNISPELLSIWLKYIGKNDMLSFHFFEAGANSIKALLMLKEIQSKLQANISAADFFKNPTLDFLNRHLTKTESNNLVWQLKKVQGNKELWLLPPIMGFGFIFNSLNLPAINAFAFNYPMAMGIEEKHSISEIANALIQERISFGNMPEEVTLLGYSMGGLMAFEMAKWLESNNVKVKELIVFDKTAQPEAGRKIKRIVLTNELIDIARQISSDDKDYDRIINYLKIHEQMIEDYQQSGYLNCEITIHYCNDGFEIDDFLKWQRFSNKKINLNKISNCSHYGIPKIWNNLELNI